MADTDRAARLALFDLDNTLLDRERAFGLWTQDFLAAHGLDPTAVPVIERADADGYADREQFFRAVREALGITTPLDELLADYHVRYPSKYAAAPGTVDALRSLRRAGWKVGVVTNGPPSQLAKLAAAGVEDEFDAVCVSSLVGAHKPDPAIFAEAARCCGMPLDGWMVGDSPEADIAGGSAVGLRTIWMHRGREWSLTDCSPEFSASTIAEAVGIILGSG
jgi:HAD superfamily hydrolase (TIGR01549 family)